MDPIPVSLTDGACMRTVVAGSLLCLLLGTTTSAPASADYAMAFSIRLAYPRTADATETSPIFRAPGGKEYQLWLDPQRDIDKNLVVFELVMSEANRATRGTNLLDSTGRLHGYQKWFFAASDFARGAARSIYGSQRTIALPKRGMEVVVKVLKVRVERPPAGGHRFTELEIQASARSISAQGRPTSTS